MTASKHGTVVPFRTKSELQQQAVREEKQRLQTLLRRELMSDWVANDAVPVHNDVELSMRYAGTMTRAYLRAYEYVLRHPACPTGSMVAVIAVCVLGSALYVSTETQALVLGFLCCAAFLLVSFAIVLYRSLTRWYSVSKLDFFTANQLERLYAETNMLEVVIRQKRFRARTVTVLWVAAIARDCIHVHNLYFERTQQR